MACRAPIPPGGCLLAQAAETVLNFGLVHIGRKHRVAIAEGAGFIKHLLKHSCRPPNLWESLPSRTLVLPEPPPSVFGEVGISIALPSLLDKKQTGQSFRIGGLEILCIA